MRITMAPRRNVTATAVQGKLVLSNKKRLLACNGNLYTPNQKRRAANTINWRCVKTGICNATAKTIYLDLESVEVGTNVEVVLGKEHLHENDEAEILVKENVGKMKERAINEANEAPSNIIQAVTNEEILYGYLKGKL